MTDEICRGTSIFSYESVRETREGLVERGSAFDKTVSRKKENAFFEI